MLSMDAQCVPKEPTVISQILLPALPVHRDKLHFLRKHGVLSIVLVRKNTFRKVISVS